MSNEELKTVELNVNKSDNSRAKKFLQPTYRMQENSLTE